MPEFVNETNAQTEINTVHALRTLIEHVICAGFPLEAYYLKRNTYRNSQSPLMSHISSHYRLAKHVRVEYLMRRRCCFTRLPHADMRNYTNEQTVFHTVAFSE